MSDSDSVTCTQWRIDGIATGASLGRVSRAVAGAQRGRRESSPADHRPLAQTISFQSDTEWSVIDRRGSLLEAPRSLRRRAPVVEGGPRQSHALERIESQNIFWMFLHERTWLSERLHPAHLATTPRAIHERRLSCATLARLVLLRLVRRTAPNRLEKTRSGSISSRSFHPSPKCKG